MKAKSTLIAALLMSCSIVLQVHANEAHHAEPAAQQGPESGSAMTEGEVRKVDNNLGKITIRHDELKNLGMPAMTMVFHVNDKSLLENVKAGDKIRFVADKVGNKFIVMEMELKQ